MRPVDLPQGSAGVAWDIIEDHNVRGVSNGDENEVVTVTKKMVTRHATFWTTDSPIVLEAETRIKTSNTRL